jgi:pimeloyl-ACP methyl ester carboxylesterase
MIAGMRTINWRGSRINIKSQTVQVGSDQLELRRCFREGTRKGKGALGPPVFAVAGFLETVDIFFSRDGEGGLAPFLAALGYDVYLGELRGRGSSWPLAGKGSDWGLEESIEQDIPAHLQTVARQRPGEPQFWLGQGLGSLLLNEVYARKSGESPAVLGMIHFGASRQIELADRRKAAAYRRQWCAARLMALARGYVGIPFSDPPRRESRQSLLTLRQWQEEAAPREGSGTHQPSLPPSLYFANAASTLWGKPDDCRRWMRELGPHDGRLIAVGKSGGNLRNYPGRDLLQHPAACEDHFLQLQEWLDEWRQAVEAGKASGKNAEKCPA